MRWSIDQGIGLSLYFVLTGALWTTAMASNARTSQGRSMVMAQGGIVAAEHPLAAQAGAVVLAKAKLKFRRV